MLTDLPNMKWDRWDKQVPICLELFSSWLICILYTVSPSCFKKIPGVLQPGNPFPITTIKKLMTGRIVQVLTRTVGHSKTSFLLLLSTSSRIKHLIWSAFSSDTPTFLRDGYVSMKCLTVCIIYATCRQKWHIKAFLCLV